MVTTGDYRDILKQSAKSGECVCWDIFSDCRGKDNNAVCIYELSGRENAYIRVERAVYVFLLNTDKVQSKFTGTFFYTTIYRKLVIFIKAVYV